jgi:hypothetical protein
MVNTNLSAIVAAYMLYIAKGETPSAAIEFAVIDVKPAVQLERHYEKVLNSARREVFSFLHPEVPERIKSGAFHLQEWFLNTENLKEGELNEIENYIDDMQLYFSI